MSADQGFHLRCAENSAAAGARTPCVSLNSGSISSLLPQQKACEMRGLYPSGTGIPDELVELEAQANGQAIAEQPARQCFQG